MRKMKQKRHIGDKKAPFLKFGDGFYFSKLDAQQKCCVESWHQKINHL